MKKIKRKTGRRILSFMLSLAMVVTLTPVALMMQTDKASAVTEVNAPRVTTEGTTWDCVYFGSYPQTEIVDKASNSGCYGRIWSESGDYVVDSSLYSKLQTASFSSNGNTTINGIKYKRIKQSDATNSSLIDEESYVWSKTPTYRYFRYDKILWRVLEKSNGYALLLSDVALDDQRYNEECTDITWKRCTLRSWLNGYSNSSNDFGKSYSSNNFLDTAFSSSEQSAINKATLENIDNMEAGTSGGVDTNDRVFLLSESDVCNTEKAVSYGFSSDAYEETTKRCAKSSSYAKAMGTYSGYGNSFWELRTPGRLSSLSIFVEFDGRVAVEGGNVDDDAAIRPALYLDLSSSVWSNAGTVNSAISPILSFSSSSLTKKTTDAAFTNRLTTNTDGTITYKSSNTAVATVSSTTGKVTIKGAGSCKITASAAETSAFKAKSASYSLTVTQAVEKQTPTMSFASNSLTKKTTDAAFTNKLTTNTDGTITYKSSNTAVATVSSTTGKVTIKGAGTCKITASAAETSNYTAGTASFTLTVKISDVMNATNLSYSFENFSKTVPLSICKYMYGNNSYAERVYYSDIGNGGNCFGMATSAGILYVPGNDTNVNGFNSSATKISELAKSNKNSKLNLTTENFIQAMHITQVSPYMPEEQFYTASELNKLIDVVKQEASKSKPLMLAVYGYEGGHAVLAYGIKEISSTETRILVYDNNFPLDERYVTIKKNSMGKCTSWKYDLGFSGIVWGSSYDGVIGYTKYDDYYYVWQNRGHLSNLNSNLLITNTDNMTISDAKGNEVATVENGRLVNENEDVRVVLPMGININNPDYSTNNNCVIMLPVDHYVIKNNDPEIDNFEVSLTNRELGASVTTEADKVVIFADDAENDSGASINNATGKQYTICLETSKLGEPSNVTYSGISDDSTVDLKVKNGIKFEDFDASIVSEGEKNTLDFTKEDVQVKLNANSFTYTGKYYKPVSKVTSWGDELTGGKDYKVTYNNNKNAGTATATVTGIGNCFGSKKFNFTIKPATISGVTSTLSATSYVYDGNLKKPSATVEGLAAGTDYKITYSNNRYVGKATAKITGLNNYTGTIIQTFKINPKGTSIRSLSKARKAFTVKWNKQATQTSGYQIRYSRNSDMSSAKTVTISGTSTVSKTVKSLYAKKKYYVQVRTYKTVNSVKYYSNWSAKKYVTTK